MVDGGTILVRLRNLDDEVELSVCDEGCGMDASTASRMFEPFFTTKGAFGSGLGLSMSHGLIEASGGRLEVDSEVGVGTAVRVILPRERDPAPAPAPFGPSVELVSGGGERCDEHSASLTETVLVIEDSDRVRLAVVSYLRAEGVRVLEARSGEEASVIAERQAANTIALVIADVLMPGMSGPDAVREVRKQHPGARALFISGYTKDLLKAEDLVDAAYLRKPFSPSLLSETVRSLLDHDGSEST